MKKILAFSLCAAVILSLAGCGKTPDASPSPSASPSGLLQSPNAQVAPLCNFIEVEDTEDVDMSISFPALSGMTDQAVQTDINTLLFELAVMNYEDNYKADVEYYHLTADPTYIGGDAVSFAYRAEVQYKGSSYMTAELAGHSIDLATGEELKITSYVTLDEVRAAISGGTAEAIDDTVSGEYTLAQWADMVDENTAFYLTDTALVVALTVPHELGDYVEWSMPRAAG